MRNAKLPENYKANELIKIWHLSHSPQLTFTYPYEIYSRGSAVFIVNFGYILHLFLVFLLLNLSR